MNNNRSNRRRGRGNRNQGGGNQLNRIDSRARGNAPQLLDKYKKLAQDAQHNGDRVQAEYYLQFADHYFRVIADNKARQDEARAKRGDDRDQNDDEDEGQSEGQRGFEGEVADEADQSGDAQKEERKPRRQRADTRGSRRRPRDNGNGHDESAGIDASALPPSIGNDDQQEERTPRPRRRKVVAAEVSDKGDDDVQAVG